MSTKPIDLNSILGARESAVPEVVAPMLASAAERAFSAEGWLYEPKLDGIRCVAKVKNGACSLYSRRGLDITYQYPSLAHQLEDLCPHEAVLDGEIIALNEQGKPSFQHLQQRMNLTKKIDIARAEVSVPAYFFAFDLIYLNGYSLTGVKLVDRRVLLRQCLAESTRVRVISSFEDDGVAAYNACVDNGFEGIVAKRKESRYESGRRSPSWLKVKAQQTGEFVIGGFTAGQGSRSTIFGALMLGYYNDENKLIYAGSVGTGFDEKLLREIMTRLRPLITKTCPFKTKPDEKKEVTWTNPSLVIEVKFMDWTRDGHLRTPVFLRFRDDKEALAVTRERFVKPFVAPDTKLSRRSQELSQEAPDSLPVAIANEQTKQTSNADPGKIIESVVSQLQDHGANFMLHVGTEKFQITSLEKILWPQTESHTAITKRDYLIYLAKISPIFLRHLHARPLTVLRSPWGVRGKPFYQKHWHTAIPEFFETTLVADAEDPDGRREHLLCNNLATLLFLGQNGILEFHVSPARLERGKDLSLTTASTNLLPPEQEGANLDNADLRNFPDYLIFDLDLHPLSTRTSKFKAAPSNESDFARVCNVACGLRDALRQLQVQPLAKVSGKGGIHVIIPIVRNIDFDHARVLAETMSRFLAQLRPEDVTLEASLDKRHGKVYLDTGANIAGKTMICAYSPRFTEEATVSLPVSWQEIERANLIPCTLNDTLERVKQRGDLWKDILTNKSDLQEKISNRSTSKTTRE